MKKTVNKRLKYGSFAVAFTVVVLALVIIVNAIFSILAEKHSLYADMTTEQLYSVSDAADSIFSVLGEKEIDIIFFSEEDMLRGSQETKLVYEYAKKLSEKYDYVNVDYIDPIENPTEIKNRIPGANDINTTDVAISNGKEFRKYALEKFFTFDSQSGSVFAFNAEYRFATAFMQLTYDEMKACFTVGHGETTSSANLKTLFEEAGFSCVDIDLMKEDIPEDARVLIINDPTRDFSTKDEDGDDNVDEINKIRRFLNKRDSMGNLMVFCSAEHVEKLKNLNELLWDWGIKFTPALVEDEVNTISFDYQSVIAKYSEEGDGASLVSKLSDMENSPKTIVRNPTPIEIRWDATHDYLDVSSVLTSHDTAVARSLEDDSIVEKGEMNLMTISKQMTLGDNYEKYYNYVLAAGTSSFVDAKYLDGNTYGNSDIIYETMRAFGVEMVPVDLDFKVFDSQALDVTIGQANAWTVIFTAGMPAVFLTAGLVVWIRRKHL